MPLPPAPLMTAAVMIGRGSALGDPATRKLTVLLVERDPADRLLGREMLERAGHTAHTAHDWDSAKGIISRTPLDALLLDVRCPGVPVPKPRRGMPAADARIVGIRLVRGWPPPIGGLPLLAIVGRTEPGLAKACMEADCDALLIRPLEAESLERLLREAVVGRTPPAPLDLELRATLHATRGLAAVREQDAAALAEAGAMLQRLNGPPSPEAVEEAAGRMAAAMDTVGGIALARTARAVEAEPARRQELMQQLIDRLIATRTALRREVPPAAVPALAPAAAGAPDQPA